MANEENNNQEELDKKVQEETTKQEEPKEEVVAEEVVEETKASDETKLQDELDEMTDRYKRLMAEFENFKKRTQKDKEGLKDMLISDIMISILPVMDNLEKAAKAPTEDKAYKEGIKMVLKQLQDALMYNGVKEIETVGKKFDPELHEAVSHVTDEKHGENIIIEEFRKGYRIGNKVIRHSMVIVAN